MKILRKEQLVRSKSCHFYFLPNLSTSIDWISITQWACRGKKSLCSFNAPSRFLLNENFNWIGFFQIVAHQWIKFLYQALEEQKWIWYLLKGQSSFRSIQNLKFECDVRFTYFQLDYEPKGFFHDHENLSFKKPIAKTLISFRKTILTKD